MWDTLRKAMGNLWDAQRHEDEYAVGVPDVSFGARGVQGWIELKQIPRWPSKTTTLIKLGHFKKEQRAWLKIRQIHGDLCWMLLKVDKIWMIFSPDKFQYVGTTTKDDLIRSANKVWIKTPEPYEFIDLVTKQEPTLNMALQPSSQP